MRYFSLLLSLLGCVTLIGCERAGPAPAAPVIKYEYQTYEWKENQPPVKMIHKDEGFCYIMGFAGAFHGGGEWAKVNIGDDGYWYLSGDTKAGFLRVTAISVKMKAN
jgi:hypothetical protein